MKHPEDLPFLRGGGELGRLMRGHDWTTSPLGQPASWPQPLRTATAMMLNTQQPMFIAWGPRLAFTYNDAYAPILGARHPSSLGMSFEEVWADIWDDLSPLARRALAGEAVWQEDLPLLMHRNGYPEETYFTFTYSPLHDETGSVAGMYCTCIETTARVLLERKLRETADLLRDSEARYRSQGERLFTLFEKAPGFVAVVDGPEHVFTLVNEAYRQLIGHRDVLGRPVRAALPEVAATGLFEVLDDVFATGEPFVGAGLEVPLQRHPGGTIEQRFVDFIYQPVRSEAGEITGIICQGSDVTDRELFVEKQQLLLNELNHRVKNNLARVQSMAVQTARRSPDLPTFISDFQGRLVALARTHDVLTARAWSGAELGDVLAAALSPFSNRVELDGPSVELNSAQALALGLVIHELATNAAKYGALSVPSGELCVNWEMTAPDAFTLSWDERGGPEVHPPKQTGFGTRLIEKLSSGDLGGELKMNFDPAGLRVILTAPVLCPEVTP